MIDAVPHRKIQVPPSSPCCPCRTGGNASAIGDSKRVKLGSRRNIRRGSDIRVVLAIAHLGKGGGVALQAFQLFQNLRRTIEVEMVCLDDPGPHRNLTQEPGVVVAGPLVFPKGIRTLSEALRSTRRRGDVFHALDPYYAFPATYLARV